MFPGSRQPGALVLVHGAWVGEWSWLPIEADLRASGRPVHMVSLRGHGARRYLGGPHVTLAQHVSDVVELVETLDLVDVTLVGHSYGGRVISQAWVQLRERISHLVYVDAHTPVAPDPGQTPDRIALAAKHNGMLPFPARYLPSPEMVGGKEGVAWFRARAAPQSFATLSAPWQVELPDELAKTFVFASGDAESRFAQYSDVCASDPHWGYHEIAGHHFLMMSNPAEVTQILLSS